MWHPASGSFGARERPGQANVAALTRGSPSAARVPSVFNAQLASEFRDGRNAAFKGASVIRFVSSEITKELPSERLVVNVVRKVLHVGVVAKRVLRVLA